MPTFWEEQRVIDPLVHVIVKTNENSTFYATAKNIGESLLVGVSITKGKARFDILGDGGSKVLDTLKPAAFEILREPQPLSALLPSREVKLAGDALQL
jgi:hypothetical protein